MSRVQLSINVSDFDAAVAFYSRLLGAEPAKVRPGYANFAIDDPPLKLVQNSPGNGPGGTINHLGVEVGSTGDVTHAEARLASSIQLVTAIQNEYWSVEVRAVSAGR
jgi:catechol 2,3-dioxygenase-like lactoylglutathione lyase family enzyme